MILTIELIPSTSWFSNLRSLLEKEEWDKIRKGCYKKAAYKCEICGGKGPIHPVECHETWDYDEEKKIQKLVGLIALCPSCHQTKHYGLAMINGKEQSVKKHLMKINSLTEKEVDEYIKLVFEEWKRRNKIQWTLDVSILDTYKLL